MPHDIPAEGRRRVAIERVAPEIDAGRFPAKRVPGEPLVVEADIFGDGHDSITCVLRHRAEGDKKWTETPMRYVDNDRWSGSFTPTDLGRYAYTIEAWVDRFGSWRRDTEKKIDAGQDVRVELQAGAAIVAEAAKRARGRSRTALQGFAERLDADTPDSGLVTDPELTALMDKHPDRSHSTTYEREMELWVDPPLAVFGAWYELFPRSFGTFNDLIGRLDYVAGMGFDVLYLPPIHPIGRTFRKGRNNSPTAVEGEPGSPWAIGSEQGGHTSIDPGLGTMEDFERLVAEAKRRGLSVALDIAFQCSPDHPWVTEHPEWFKHRPDGTIQYAENPPKKYQDIYPLDFESSDWQGLWRELRRVVEFWIDHGVTAFRVDNPHTKAFDFWEWMIGGIRRQRPDVIFLSEAFTRPRVMERLAKLGFNQSYTYFTWRNTRWELEDYFRYLTQTQVAEYFRPNLWPNTPDILPEFLQHGGRPAFMSRLVLAATLGSSYGIYGPAFELCRNVAVAPGKEEYLDSEKYEVAGWDLDGPESIAEFITLVNRIRRENPALHSHRGVRFLDTANDHLIGYCKTAPDGENIVIVVVNLDPHHTQAGSLDVPIHDFGIPPDRPYEVHDLLTNAHYSWQGHRNYVELDPHSVPAHIFELRHSFRTERDYETFQ